MKTSIEFTRIDNDTNGNPRYVCHFLDIPLTTGEQQVINVGTYPLDCRLSIRSAFNKKISKRFISHSKVDFQYQLATFKANQIGGKKYNTKKYGGGIVFQSYNIHQTEQDILNIINS